ncbi:MAG: S-layer homology domain-containing protein [Oscillospiraceae bacterium]|jgi:hypothetical protein|nr:S-layer homology domain-containing protein [Oscillospiraceae bacterium]
MKAAHFRRRFYAIILIITLAFGAGNAVTVSAAMLEKGAVIGFITDVDDTQRLESLKGLVVTLNSSFRNGSGSQVSQLTLNDVSAVINVNGVETTAVFSSAESQTQSRTGYFVFSGSFTEYPATYRIAMKIHGIEFNYNDLPYLVVEADRVFRTVSPGDSDYEPFTAGGTLPPFTPSDVPSSWAAASVGSAIAKGFVPADLQTGYANTINRLDFCRLAVKYMEYATGKPIDTILSERGLRRDSNAFTDVTNADVLAAHALGVTSGTGGGVFNPYAEFSRESAAGMIMNLHRAMGFDVSNPAPSSFSDAAQISTWTKAGVDYCVAAGIMGGNGGAFNPKGLFTREMSIMTFDNMGAALPEPDSSAFPVTFSVDRDIMTITGYTVAVCTASDIDYYEERFQAARSLPEAGDTKIIFYGSNLGVAAMQNIGCVFQNAGGIRRSHLITVIYNSENVIEFAFDSTATPVSITLTNELTQEDFLSFKVADEIQGERGSPSEPPPEPEIEMYDRFPSVPDFGAWAGHNSAAEELEDGLYMYGYEDVSRTEYESYRTLLRDLGFSYDAVEDEGVTYEFFMDDAYVVVLVYEDEILIVLITTTEDFQSL